MESTFPGRYRYPGETEIAKFISAQFQKTKKSAGEDHEARRRQRKISQEVEDKIQDLMKAFSAEKGRAIEARVCESFGRHLIYLSKHLISTKGKVAKVTHWLILNYSVTHTSIWFFGRWFNILNVGLICLSLV